MVCQPSTLTSSSLAQVCAARPGTDACDTDASLALDRHARRRPRLRERVRLIVPAHAADLYRPSKSIFHTINAIAAVRMLFENLPRCKAEPDNLKVREQLLLGAALGLSWAEFSLAMGPSHSLGHRFGASAAVPHGICSSVYF